jgi:hypothetical protein
MSTRRAANCFWTPLSIASDQDLVGAARACAVPIAAQLFEGLRAELAPHLDAREAPQLAITDRDFASYSTPAKPLSEAATELFALRSHDGAWNGLQYKESTLLFGAALLREITLEVWYPARSPGGYDVTGTFGSLVAPRSFAHVEIAPDGERRDVVSNYPETFRFRLAYHVSEAAAFRLLRALQTLAAGWEISVRLAECSDC